MTVAIHDQIPEQALRWHRAGVLAALATVIETWGSAPRPVGSQLAINFEAEIMGSVSGGCVEGAVVAEAQEALADGTCRVLEYGVSDDEAFAVGLACGGRIRVMVEPVGRGQGPSAELLEGLVAARAERRAIAYAVDTDTWQRRLIMEGDDPLWREVQERFRTDQSGFEGDTFIGIHNPPLRMIVVGAVHIAQPLLQMARLAGYDPVLVDPRDAFATDQRFPNQVISRDWPDAALQTLGLDARTAVVTLTHDPKLDDPAIRTALGADVFYLGALGSTRTHAKRVIRLQESGFSDAEIARIHAPVGADIGAKTPSEIAISIMAEITERLRRPETRPV
ncbi:XdhC family protein [Halovulum sp. GXIMD14793]